MNRHVLNEIEFSITPEIIAEHARIKKDSIYFKTLEQFVQEVQRFAKPRGLYKAVFFEAKGDDQVIIENITFNSRVLKVNLENVHRVFPFVATCGREMDHWSGSITDTLSRFIADAIKGFALQAAVLAMNKHIQENYDTAKLSRMTPGSLTDWPITEQRPLFNLLGDVEGAVGVRLMDSLMMNPVQSVSGIMFPTEVRFESCRLCPRENCPGRRAVYDKTLYEKRYQKKEKD